MSQPRVDVYTPIHKGLRSAMYQTGVLLERTNFADPDEKAEAIESTQSTLGFFDEHLALEDQFIMPLLSDIADPDLASELAGHHDDHQELSEAVKDLIEELSTAEGPEAVGLGFELCKLFNVMVADQSEHMNLEERDGNAAMWEAKSDPELVALRNEIQAAIAPPRFAQWLSLMVPNLNHQELVGMLSGMKAGAPPDVFARVSGMAQQLLGTRWKSIEVALS